MKRSIVFYALALVLGALALQWFEYRLLVRSSSLNAWIVVVVTAFALLGVWVGTRLVSQKQAAPFERNTAAVATLGISPRELDVLGLLASGGSNKEIARDLGISPNTVKTHITSLFVKLEVSRRTEAIHRSRTLGLVP